MTLLLASVADAEEAADAAAGGADIVDFKDPTRGAAAPEIVEAGVRAVGGRAATSATLGDPPYDAASLTRRARRFRAAGVDMLRVAVDDAGLDALAEPLAALAREGRLIGLLFADEAPDFALLPRLAALGFSGAMLDTRVKGAARLIDHLGIARLQGFCIMAQALGLTAGLAGSLEPPDIPRLLLTGADMLGFRSALRVGTARPPRLDPKALTLVRDLIPNPRALSARAPEVDLHKRGPGPGAEDELDCIFVRDFVVETEIGAYEFERGRRQRVAFDVEARIGRAVDPLDLRTIFSYDVILDAIRLVTAQGRHDFVEGVAEEVAAIVLAHARVRAVRIVVQKLDVISGAVGVEILRRRAAPVMPAPASR